MRPNFGATSSQQYASAILEFILCGIASAFALRYIVNWIYIDDLSTLSWFSRFDQGTFGILDLSNAWSNQHPVGSQIAVIQALRSVFGVNFRVLSCSNFIVVMATFFISKLVFSYGTFSLPYRLALSIVVFSQFFQPTQTEHLLWSFELGWFLVNFFLLLSLWAAKYDGLACFLSAFTAGTLATFSSAQGCFVWFAIAGSYALRRGPHWRLKALATVLLGTFSVVRLIQHSHDDSQPLSLSDTAGLTIYFFQVYGAAFAIRSHLALFVLGVSFFTLIVVVLTASLKVPLAWSQQASLCLMGCSILSIASFAKGRFYLGIDWALTAYHAAPMLVPFLVGVSFLAAFHLRRASSLFQPGSIAALSLHCMLIVSFCGAVPYAFERAEAWSRDLGYAKWLSCEKQAPIDVQARAAGLEPFAGPFEAVMPYLRPLCGTSEISLATQLVHPPVSFMNPEVRSKDEGAALKAIWQEYALDSGLQHAFPVDSPDLRKNLIGYVKSTFASEDGLGPKRLGPFRNVILALP